MSRTRYGHNVNASLIRELRMIAQDLFYTQRARDFWGSRLRSKPVIKHYAPPTCVFCLPVRNEPNDAITVMNGQAVCGDHMYYTQGGEYTRILGIIQKDEIPKKSRR